MFEADPSLEKEAEVADAYRSTEGATASLDTEGEERGWPEADAILDRWIWPPLLSPMIRRLWGGSGGSGSCMGLRRVQ